MTDHSGKRPEVFRCNVFSSRAKSSVPASPQPQPHDTVSQMLEFAWSKGPAQPQGLQDGNIHLMDKWLVNVGGFGGGLDDNWKSGVYPRGFLNKTWGLNLADEAASWISLPPFPAVGRQALQGTVVNGKYYVWGGFNYTAPYTYSDGYCLSLEDGKGVWEALPPLPYPLAFAGAYALKSRIYLLGGTDYDRKRFYTRTDRTGSVKHLGSRLIMLDTNDLDSGWNELSPCPGSPRCLPTSSTVIAGKIYAIGGITASNSGPFLNVVDSWCYEPVSDSWQRLRDLPITGSGYSSGIPVFRDRYILLPAGYQYNDYMKLDGSIAPKYGSPSRVERTWDTHPRLKDMHYYNHFYIYDVRSDLYGTANNLPFDDVHPPTVVVGDSVYMLPNETAGFVWEGEYFGHHPEFVLKGAIRELDWE